MHAAADHLRRALSGPPSVAVVLGSGLSHLADRLTDATVVAFEDVPGLPASGVAGHAGRWVRGALDGSDVLLQAGRYHAYEGHPMELVVAPVRILAALGVQTMVFTNAAGGIAQTIGPGDLVLLDDHINLMFRSPLAGPVPGSEQRFPDMSAPYDAELQACALRVAGREGFELERGVYAAVLGPAYETAAEVRMLGRLGADVVGMSTVPEVVTARALGLRCLAISVVTNKATGLSSEPIAHEDVMEIGRQAGRRLGSLLAGILREIAEAPQSGETK